MRRFNHGDQFTVGPFRYRVVRGRKGPNDLRLDQARSTDPDNPQWYPVPMDSVFLICDFLYENEDHLYPPPRFSGGDMLIGAIHLSVRDGWKVGVDELSRLRRNPNRDIA